MSRKSDRQEAATAAERTARRDRAVVQVRLDETLPEVRARFEALWDRREAKARSLRDIRNSTGPRNDANAVQSEGQAYAGGMRRNDGTPVRLPKKVQPEFLPVVAQENPDDGVSDGTTDDEKRVETGTFKRGQRKRESAFGV
jgi:hypothetical protein